MIINVQISWGKQAMPILCKDSANRIQSKLVCFVEVQPILCKGNKKRLIAARNHILLSYIEAATC